MYKQWWYKLNEQWSNVLSLIFFKKTLIRPSSPYLLAKKKKTRNPPGQNYQSNCATKITNTTSRNPIRTIDQLNPTENNQDQNKAIIATTLNHFCINNIFNSLSLFFLSKNSTTQQHHPSQQNKKKNTNTQRTPKTNRMPPNTPMPIPIPTPQPIAVTHPQ